MIELWCKQNDGNSGKTIYFFFVEKYILLIGIKCVCVKRIPI